MTQEEEWLLTDKYNDIVTPAFESDRERLRNGEPLAYVIGWIPFLDTRIFLDSHPLIPRPETEYWVAQACTEIRTSKNARVLDLCAGSGCIGIALLHSIEDIHVDFAEIDASHHATILKNLHENGISTSQTQIIGGDLFSNVTKQYDYILSNPPYIDPALDRATESVRVHEPATALYGGIDGFEIIARIITEAPAFLTPKGVLIIEHEPEQSASICHTASLSGFETEVCKDQFGVERFSLLRLSS
jgi:release factor glutamine methyltransferase